MSVIYLIAFLLVRRKYREERLGNNHPWGRPYFECQSHYYEAPNSSELNKDAQKEKPQWMRALVLAILVFTLPKAVLADPLIPVPIALFEPIKENHSHIAEPNRVEFLKSIDLFERLLRPRLQSCGYQLIVDRHFFATESRSQLFLEAKNLSKDTWFIIGPRQSDNYFITSLAAKEIPSVSTMATSKEVRNFGEAHKTLGSHPVIAAARLIEEAASRLPSATYITVTRSDCLSCKDFAAEFDFVSNKRSFKKLKEFSFKSATAPMDELVEWLATHKPDFILIPTKGDFAARIISRVHSLTPKSIFLGSDGWGDAHFGAIRNLNFPPQFKAIFVRPVPPPEIFVQQLRLPDAQKRDLSEFRFSAGLLIYSVLEKVSNLLCDHHPKTPGEFKRIFEKSKDFQQQDTPHIYTIENGKFHYVGR